MPNCPPELEGGVERFMDERGRDLDRWFLAVRSIFAVGLAGFLSIDFIDVTRPTTAIMPVLAGYVAANVVAWTTVGMRTAHARWLYMAVDVAFVLVVRHLFEFRMVVDPNATMVGLFTLLLLTYTIYGDPRLTTVLAGASMTSTIAFDVLAGSSAHLEAVGFTAQPMSGLLQVAYLAAFCILAIALSRRLRRHAVEHGVELMKRLEATMTSAAERSRREKIEELNRLKRDFIAVLSHELRTPLTPLRSSLDLLVKSEDEPATRPELLDIAIESTEKLQRLVLDYTQLAELLTEKDADLARWNLEMSGFMEVLRGGSNFRRVTMAGLDGLHVAVDPKLLAAGLLALLRRAQLVSKRSTISVCGFSHSSGVTLSVHDPESYIDRDLTEILDDPFGLSSERTFVSPNTGMELILARYALQRTGGTLRVTSSEYRGTTAFCTLPGMSDRLDWLDRAQIQYELEPVLLYSVR